jgi:uncharacterized protein (PEP-CTERM system associated)
VCAGLAASNLSLAATWTFTPQLGIRGTYTDNVGLQPPGSERSDTIMTTAPGFRLKGEGARLKLDATYTMENLTYLHNSQSNAINHQLNALANLEAIEKWFYIDTTARISQQNNSAFGPQPVDNINTTANRTNVFNYSVSPYVKGLLGSDSSYLVRHNTYGVQTNNATSTIGLAPALSDSTTNEWIVQLKGLRPLRVFNWGLDYNKRKTQYDGRQSTDSEYYFGTVYARIDVNLTVSGNVGHEANNYSLTDQSMVTHGVGFQWTPSAATSVVGQYDQRLFTPYYSLVAKHRRPLSAFEVALTQSVTNTNEALFRGTGSTIYDLLYASTSTTLSPVERDAAVQGRLQAAGISPNFVPTLGLNTTRLISQKRLQASYAINGVRNTLTFTAYKAQSQNVSSGFSVSDDFNANNKVDQTGVNVVLSHRLTPLTSLNAFYGRTRSIGDGPVANESTVDYGNVSLVTKLSPKTTATLGLRHVRSTGTTPYRENAINAGVNLLF